ncbi:uncharacterized protein K460DRAFT_420100 [Cucurbitaria berberidis CBS 394.84]|uniref:Clr5 domain-containing protein n=1 Tax=Cucurbitaria berberidis CBS 394.84 TaxID=1168544 RepID=A0A9P4GAW5_9PLEO|nr:uncharacterized protein K460DRAFT_420100 [Cucurbitaria berberidis CBS 394.84]KAF1842159.1 hypothetical protein K460DRAFT_420100 [Cucurbitaria berberidis CBS 394.84]
MPSQRQKDMPDSTHDPNRSVEAIELDQFADAPQGSTNLLNWLACYPSTHYFPSAQELRKLSRHRVHLIFERWRFLNQILERHEGTIRKKWTEKSVEQRRELLLAVLPSIPEMHRPEQEQYQELSNYSSQGPGHAVSRFFKSTTCMLPDINLEDLLRQKTLLAFLNARGRNHPATFAGTELVKCPLHAWEDEPLWKRLAKWTMEFSCNTDETFYGRMKKWKYTGKAKRFVYAGQGFHPGNGIQVINIQLLTYSFLTTCCIKILHDLVGGENDIYMHAIKPEPSSLSLDSADYNTLAEAAQLAPYGIPSQLDFNRLRGLIFAKVNDLEDHIWALREDPGYFAEVFQDHKSHRAEFLAATSGQTHNVLKRSPKTITNLILRNMVVDPYFMLYHWHECLRLVDALEDTARRNNFYFPPTESLPTEYYDTFIKLWQILYAIHTDTHECFRQRVPASPPLRPFFIKTVADPNSHLCRFVINKNRAGTDGVTRRFITALSMIWNKTEPPVQGFDTELDELDRLVTSEPSARALITPLVWADFSQLSTSSECIHQIRSYQPWATRMERDMQLPTLEGTSKVELKYENIIEDYMAFTDKWSTIVRQKRFEGADLASVGDPGDGRFTYPIIGERNRTNTELLCKAENHLDVFWQSVDAYCKKMVGARFPDLLDRDITHGRTLRRTPAWEDPAPAQKATEKTFLNTPKYDCQPCSLTNHEEASEEIGKFEKLSLSTEVKPKARGADLAQEANTSPPKSPDIAPSLALHATKKVDKRSLKVFKALFYTPLSSDIPGELQWTDFLHAMTKLGFSVKKLRGSAWKLTPGDFGVGGSIQFHEPHPGKRLSLECARRYGRRLEMRYGWTSEMFILAQ